VFSLCPLELDQEKNYLLPVFPPLPSHHNSHHLSWNKFIHRCNIRWCSFRYQNKFMHNILKFLHMHHTQNNHHHHHINVKIIIPFSVGNRLLQTNSIQFWILIWRKLVISRYVSEIASIIIFSIWCSWPISKVGD
jgi:hypothetical protein